MNYELRLFEDIVNGHLSPYHSSNYDTAAYRKYLSEKHQVCYVVTVATFRKIRGKFVFYRKSVFNSLNPTADIEPNGQLGLFESMPLEDVATEVYTLLDVSREEISSVEHLNRSNVSVLRIRQVVDCYELPEKEVRYYYYAELMAEEARRIKQEIQKTVFEFRTVNETKLYIHKLQQSIIHLSYQVGRMFTDKEQRAIYETAKEFSNTDIMNCCYIILERLLRFLEKNYLQYIDENIQIPFRSSLLKSYGIPQKLGL